MENLPNFARLIRSRIEEALKDTPVILLGGPRQAGKTTLVRQMAAGKKFNTSRWMIHSLYYQPAKIL